LEDSQQVDALYILVLSPFNSGAAERSRWPWVATANRALPLCWQFLILHHPASQRIAGDIFTTASGLLSYFFFILFFTQSIAVQGSR